MKLTMNRFLLLFLIGIIQSGCSLIFHSPPKKIGEDMETSPETPDLFVSTTGTDTERKAQIYNQGEITIQNFTLTQPEESHYGICNQDEGTIFIQTANLEESATTQADNCKRYAGNSYPDTI